MLHKHLLPHAVWIAAAVIVSGCSSVDPENQEVSVSSSPSGATVTINGKVMNSTTNTSFELPRESDYVIVVSKTGYIPATVQIQKLPTGAEAEGLPRFQLSTTDVKVTLEEDPFAAFENFEEKLPPFAEAEAIGAAAATDTAKLDRLAEEKLAREQAEARAAAEAKATAEAAMKQAAADLAAEEALAKQAAEAEAARLAAEAKVAAEAKAAAEAKIAAEEAAAVAAAEQAAANEAAAKQTAEKTAAENAKQAALEAELKAANEKIAALEKAKAAPAPAATDILARYKTLREQLKSGEITQAEYNAAIAKLKR